LLNQFNLLTDSKLIDINTYIEKNQSSVPGISFEKKPYIYIYGKQENILQITRCSPIVHPQPLVREIGPSGR